MRIYSIGKDVMKHWDWLEPAIQRGLDKSVDGLSAEDVLQDIIEQRSIVLVCEIDGQVSGVCKVDLLPGTVHVHTMSGKGLSRWLPELVQALNLIAKSLGKPVVSATVRPGLSKVLQGHEFKEAGVLVTRAVQ